MPHRHTPRLSTFDYRGSYRYSLTMCTYRRRPLFTSTANVERALLQISRSAERQRFEILAYCFMPDHLHLLAGGETSASDAKRFIDLAKQLSGYAHRQATGDHLWQRSSWDRILRMQDDTTTVMRYLLMNPVRAGLVDRPLDYPGSGSLVFDRQALLDVFDDRPEG
jgi:putative transposase